jgi:uncharacterized protein (TIGR03032 family)
MDRRRRRPLAPEVAAPEGAAPEGAPGLDEPKKPLLGIEIWRQFTSWLAETGISLAFTTYQTGKLFLLGLQPDGRLSVVERTFNRAMGLAIHERQLYLSTLFQLWRFDDALPPGQSHQG